MHSGMALLVHVESLLPSSGRGPFRSGVNLCRTPRPEIPASSAGQPGLLMRSSALRQAPPTANEPLAAASAVLQLIRPGSATASPPQQARWSIPNSDTS